MEFDGFTVRPANAILGGCDKDLASTKALSIAWRA
jgi:hypothetical protein